MDCAPYRSNFCVNNSEELGFLWKGCQRKRWTPRARAGGGGGVYEAIYACAVEDQCSENGCMNAFRATKCCCNSDYCNTCPSISLAVAIAPMIVVKLITF
ncbi:hypothetical protein Aduo_007774 [Ancylostoma duodenale]